QKKHTFFPGPNELTQDLKAVFQRSPISHRSYEFTERLKRVKEKLRKLSGAEFVHLLSGSGTLANEAMIAQITLLNQKGLILVNGAFGERLKNQAQKWNLDFDVLEIKWGQSFNKSEIENMIQKNSYGWLLAAHGETSTGMLNDMNEIHALCKEQNIYLCLDCISSFGALPFELSNVYLATGVSGKAIGTMTGLAFVFSNHLVKESASLPAYLDIGCYADGRIPFTVSSQMLEGLEVALQAYIENDRYELLKGRYLLLQQVEEHNELEFLTSQGYPMIVTFKKKSLPKHLGDDARMSGFDLHDQSLYLKEREWVQMSIIQPNFEQSFEKFRKWLHNYIAYEKQ
ncbi:MAG: aminotransferase class V-fold PLP-dependent enzyme, partial [Paenisporosarcina sp.]